METAVSLPDDVFEQAEKLARLLNKSHSELYREAVAEYVARHDPEAMPKDSVANVSQIVTVDRSHLSERVGRLSRKKLGRIFAGIDLVLGR